MKSNRIAHRNTSRFGLDARRSTRLLPMTLLLLAPAVMRAQVGSASLSGVVQDATGAVIPGATVVAHNTANGQERTTTTNASGGFTFSAVSNGDYDVTASDTGFSSYTIKAIHLDPGDNKSMNPLKLNAGETASVSVSTETAGIPLDSGQLSSTISARDLDRLSIVGRDAQELEKTLPGFNIRGLSNQNVAPDFTIVTIGSPTPYSSNGAPVAGITLKLDGAILTDAGNFGANLQNINDSFVSEVQVQTSNFGVDQSNGPVVVSAVTKPGTSSFHGQVYTFARYNALNANDWLSNNTGLARPNDRFIYPGAQISGPVPHTNRKLTFFAGAEDDAQRNVYAYQSAGNAIIHALVPTQAMRNGDFSLASLQQWLGPKFSQYGNINVVPTVGDNGSPIANGNIAAFIDKPTLNLINYLLPLPTRAATGPDGFNYDAQNLVNNNISQYTGRLDYAISPRNTAFVRYSFEKGKEGQPQVPYYSPQAGNVLGSVNTPGYGLENRSSVHSGAANYVTIFSPTATNEVFAALTYFQRGFVPRSNTAVQAATAGFTYSAAFANGTTEVPQLGTYAAVGGLPLALTPDFSVIALGSTTFQPNVGDNFTKVFGKHTVKVGVYVQRTSGNGTQTGPNNDTNGVIQNYYFGPAGNQFADYKGTYPDGSPAYGTQHFNSGNWLADFFEGHIQDYHQVNSNPKQNLYFWTTDFYGEDSWRVSKNLLLTGGVRFSRLSAWTDRHNVGAAIFDASLINTAQDPTTNPYPGLTWHALNPSIPNSGTGTPRIFIEPRGGFAWDVFSTGRTVVRGGAGIYRFHDATADVSSAFLQANGVRTLDLQGFGGNTLSGIGTLHLNPATYGNTGGTATSIPPSTVYALDPHDNTDPVTNNYSLSVSQQFSHNNIVQVSYVGNNSNSLLNNGTTQAVVLDNINALPVGALFTPTAAAKINALGAGGNACNPTGCTPQQISRLDTIYNYPGDNSIQNARLYPRYNQILVPHHNNFANYNALQIEFIRNTGRLNYNINYTFSKSLGILGSAADFNYTAGIDPFNLLANYGPLNFDRSQIVNFSYSYQTGKTFENRLAGAIGNNWLFSGITNLSSGGNLQTGVSFSPSFYLQGTINDPNGSYSVANSTILGTPDVNLQPTVNCDLKSNLGPHQFINGNCLGLPSQGTNGRAILPYLHGPAFFNTDITAERSFNVGKEGKQHIRLRYAAFNFINHPLTSFGTGDAGETTLLVNGTSLANAGVAANTTFGTASKKLGRRISEFSLKYEF